MAGILVNQTLSANGDTTVFSIPEGGCVVLLGDSDGNDFGGGTVTLNYIYSGTDYTSDKNTHTEMHVFAIKPELAGLQAKLTLSGASSPDLNIKVIGDK